MNAPVPAPAPIRVEDLRPGDLEDVIRIDALHTGGKKPSYWERVFRDFVGRDDDNTRVGLAARREGRLAGYLLGEVRAFEFGSEPCGWIFSIGVDTADLRGKIATSLLTECCRRFRSAGVKRVRTMVVRNDVPVLSFFRSNGFVAGSFVQLELDLEGVS
jgi:ribosomal protein S18 acetylase RimI-like enzyme